MQTAFSRIWTRVTDSTSFQDNRNADTPFQYTNSEWQIETECFHKCC